MTVYRNTGGEVVAFRDDAGKHVVQPGETFTVVGAQHEAHVQTLGGVRSAATPEPVSADATVEELRAVAGKLGIQVPANARKDELRAAVVAVTGEAAAVEDEDGELG